VTTALQIYGVVERRHFLGAVALVNSLRLLGYDEPIVFLDCGLEPEQRELLAREATVLPSQETTAPHLLKAQAPLAQPAELMLLVDVDIVLTQSLKPLVEQAAAGKIVAFADRLSGRYDTRWQQALELERPPRRQIYINTGFLLLPREIGLRLLNRLRDCAPLADVDRSLYGHGKPEDALYFLDQDILNALLASEFPPQDLEVLPHRLAPHPPFKGIRIQDEATLDCAYSNGEQPYLLHHIQRKPWLSSVPANAYSRLLPRLLIEPDLALQLNPAELPLRIRRGTLGRLARQGGALAEGFARGRRYIGIRRPHPHPHTTSFDIV
jgi:hypothetical protein